MTSFSADASLNGRTHVVIGAGAGMGAETARRLAGLGARVICVDRDVDLASTIATDIGGVGYSADVTSPVDVQRLASVIERDIGQINGLVNVVGMADFGSLADFDHDRWQPQFDIVVTHAFLVSKAFTPLVARDGTGSIAFVGSVAATRDAHNQGVYAAAKAALISLTTSLAAEFGPQHVRFNVVSPGLVDTPRIRAAVGANGMARFGEVIPLRRVAQMSEIANVLVFLMTNLASHITGQNIVVDGGASLRLVYPDPLASAS